jgi:hypothetical protein
LGASDRLCSVHDLVSNGWLRHECAADRGYSPWLTEHGTCTGLARRALATEPHRQTSVPWTTKRVDDRQAVLLDRRERSLVQADRPALRSRYRRWLTRGG